MFRIGGSLLGQMDEDLLLLFAVGETKRKVQFLCIVCSLRWKSHSLGWPQVAHLPSSSRPVLATTHRENMEPRPPCVLNTWQALQTKPKPQFSTKFEKAFIHI